MIRNLICSLCICVAGLAAANAQKPGDYMEIGGIPAFVFYVDETGQHGLAMSMPAVYKHTLKKLDKYVKKGVITEKQAEIAKSGLTLDIEGYKKSGMLNPKNKTALFEELIPLLSDDGEKNALTIAFYCNDKNLSMEEKFPWEYWATRLGEGWFIPGDKELLLYAQFYVGGEGKSNSMGISFINGGQSKKVSSDERVQTALTNIAIIGGLISSTAKFPKFGFRTLSRIHQRLTMKNWFELLDNIDGGTKEMTVQTCAVHKF